MPAKITLKITFCIFPIIGEYGGDDIRLALIIVFHYQKNKKRACGEARLTQSPAWRRGLRTRLELWGVATSGQVALKLFNIHGAGVLSP